jgi:tRNA-splicing ligase RtcB
MDSQAIQQMEQACQLPPVVVGALMPDAHVGYGLPIGGVLATEGVVIPYAVGMDIACRMKLSVLDLPVADIRGRENCLIKVLEKATRFGLGAEFKPAQEHPVMEEDWSVSPVTLRCRDKARFQVGTSGSGNHFVEFGELTLARDALGLKAGVYAALLSHSGSRGTGGQVATHYSKLALKLHPELPRELGQLAWLDLDSDAGLEYWLAMELMGRYAAANHELIHRDVVRLLGVSIVAGVENHHNFAWREKHFDHDLIVHRKGATPAGLGMVGIIPGSMATPGYVVCGRGVEASLNSAAHGAGRRMSRTATRKKFNWAEGRRFLAEHDVTLISAGLDEVPMGYKDIESVMAAQVDLVEIIARFDPKLVKMAPDGHPAED